MVCKVYTNVGGIKKLYHVCPPVRKIIHSLKLVDYLHVQADNPWYNYYIYSEPVISLDGDLISTDCSVFITHGGGSVLLACLIFNTFSTVCD